MAKKTHRDTKVGQWTSSLPPAEPNAVTKVTLGGKDFHIAKVVRHADTGRFIEILEAGARGGHFADRSPNNDESGRRKAK